MSIAKSAAQLHAYCSHVFFKENFYALFMNSLKTFLLRIIFVRYTLYEIPRMK